MGKNHSFSGQQNRQIPSWHREFLTCHMDIIRSWFDLRPSSMKRQRTNSFGDDTRLFMKEILLCTPEMLDSWLGEGDINGTKWGPLGSHWTTRLIIQSPLAKLVDHSDYYWYHNRKTMSYVLYQPYNHPSNIMLTTVSPRKPGERSPKRDISPTEKKHVSLHQNCYNQVTLL